MLARWLQILPVVIYKWLAKGLCETTAIGNSLWVIASKDILIKKSKENFSTTKNQRRFKMTINLIDKKREDYRLLAGQLAILCKNLLDIRADIILKRDPSQLIKEFEQKEQRTLDYMRRLINIYSNQPVELIYTNGGSYEQL